MIEKRSEPSKVQYFSYNCDNRLVQAEMSQSGRLESKG